jgi:DNA-binding transcriptional ArsR family regulator
VKRERNARESKVGKPRPEPDAGSLESLDRLFHERARLAILTIVLRRPDGVPFQELKEDCQLTDGNLSRHLQALREAGVIDIWKRSSIGRPRTICVITPEGRRRFLAYLDALERVVRDAMAASRAGARGAAQATNAPGRANRGSRFTGGLPGLSPA